MREKAKKLMVLALDQRTPENERIAAAFSALKIIDKGGFLDSPLDGIMASIDNENMQAAASIFETLSNPNFVKSVKKVASGIASRRRKR
jgi:hypothetical protein